MAQKRDEMKQLLKQLRSIYNKVDMNIYNSAKNVNLNTVISYIKDGKVHHLWMIMIKRNRGIIC